jgi:DTW domain-containing protein YfiP
LLLCVCFHDCSKWEQYCSWCTVRVHHLLCATFPGTPSPSGICICRNRGVSKHSNPLWPV